MRGLWANGTQFDKALFGRKHGTGGEAQEQTVLGDPRNGIEGGGERFRLFDPAADGHRG